MTAAALRIFRLGTAGSAALLVAGCDPSHLVTSPTTPEGQDVLRLFWIFLGVCTVVWVLVVAMLLWAMLRRKHQRPDPLAKDARSERRYGAIVVSLAALTGVTVIALTVLSFGAQADLFGKRGPGVTITLTGHQWWWQVTYQDPEPSRSFATANEIHVPVGVPITLQLESADVIHSFWAPSLLGKLDLIPGRHNELHFTVEKPGVYRGQCAEFCGLQHAHMGLLVFADSPKDFDAWRERQIVSAVKPSTDSQRAGMHVFTSGPCAACHSIRGTNAGGTSGPDLTHLASRTTIAADTLPLSRGTLAAWVVNAQGTKPGALMPNIELAPRDLNSLLDYLESLK